MSQDVFRTHEDAEQPTEIVGVGTLGAGGQGGVPVEQAAQHMTELQEKDKQGRLVTDEYGRGKPLTGKKLADAAREVAKQRGWRVSSVADDKLATLAEEAGSTPDRPPAEEVARQAYEDLQKHLAVGDRTTYESITEADKVGAAETAPAPAPDITKEG